MHRLGRTSLCTLPLWFLIGCGPTDLTVADKNPTMSEGGTSTKLPGDKTPGDVLPDGKGATANTTDPAKGGEPANGTDPKNEGGASEGTTEGTYFCQDLKKTPIPLSSFCDGSKDCPDGSDEIGCPAHTPFTCKDGKQLDAKVVCDGMKDCADGSDELSCPAMFTCKNGSEIFASFVCDGKDECGDKSDELNCAQGEIFNCNNGSKVLPSQVCNGKDDCGDKSDELNCPQDFFICKNGTKLPPGFVCNGKDECGDGSDEVGCSDACKDGIAKAPRLDVEQKCLLPEEPIGCFSLNDPSLTVPKKWPDVTCLQRKKDGAVFLVPEPELASEWDECTVDQLTLVSVVGPCVSK
jgi:hypothetical protein